MDSRMKSSLADAELENSIGDKPGVGKTAQQKQWCTLTVGPKTDSTGSSQHLDSRVAMGRPAGWKKVATGRPVMKSPGKPSLQRDTERAFWGEIAKLPRS